MCDKYEIRIVFFFEIFSDQFLFFRFQVEGVSDLSVVFFGNQTFRFIKADIRIFPTSGSVMSRSFNSLLYSFSNRFIVYLQEAGFPSHRYQEKLWIYPISNVQAGVFVQMSSSVMFFCANTDRFKDTVEDTDHHLFMITADSAADRRTVKIRKPEHVCATLSTLRTDLWCVDLGKSLLVEEITEASNDSFLNTESCPFSDISQRKEIDGLILLPEKCLISICQWKWQWTGYVREVTDSGQPYFFPMGSPFFVFDLTGHTDVISL